MTCIDEDTIIDYLYFLNWITGTKNLLGIIEQLDSNILVHSLRGMFSDGNWRHSEGSEQVVVALSVVRYTIAARLSLK